MELATLSNGLQVDERIYDDLNDMLTDCREAGLSPIVCSAYRTEATQRGCIGIRWPGSVPPACRRSRWRRRPPDGWPARHQ